MVERFIRRTNSMHAAKPLPPPPNQENQQFTHTSKKPVLAVTGTKNDRICAICLGKLEPGMAMTYCRCGKFFHIDCISELGDCPLCYFSIITRQGVTHTISGDGSLAVSEPEESDIMEVVYQCPACDTYVAENSESCICGAVFDIVNQDIYQCPGCGHEVSQEALRCDNCGMEYQ